MKAPTLSVTRLITAARSSVARRHRVAAVVERLMYRFPRVEDAVVALIRANPRVRYARWIDAYDTLDHEDVRRMRDDIAGFSGTPNFCVVVGDSRGDGVPSALDASLRAQIYEHWQVSVVGASVPDEWNAVLRESAADYVVVVDPSSILRPHTLFMFARTIVLDPETVLIYGDEDEIDRPGGQRSRHFFKPDWNDALIKSQNYLGGVVCFRRWEALTVGGFEQEIDQAYAWGLALRLASRSSKGRTHHLPFVLSHRTPNNVDTPVNRERGAAAVRARLMRGYPQVKVEPVGNMSYRTGYELPESAPLVSVIVPTTCDVDLLEPCVTGLRHATSYPHLEVLLVVNGTSSLTTRQRSYLDTVESAPGVRVLFHAERPFNFAKTNNWAVGQARGRVLCFLNDDTEPINKEWLSAMLSEVLQDGVAAVGAMLLYPNERIQHAGVILGVGGIGAHTYKGRRASTSGYHERALVAQDVSCVTAACMVIRREAFSAVGCFDETFAVSFNDVDLCLRLRRAGWRIVWTPAARLHHKESASLGRHHLGEGGPQWAIDYEVMQRRWGQQLLSDPYYSPNLSLDGLEVWEPAFPPRAAYPWRSEYHPIGHVPRATESDHSPTQPW